MSTNHGIKSNDHGTCSKSHFNTTVQALGTMSKTWYILYLKIMVLPWCMSKAIVLHDKNHCNVMLHV